MKEEKLVKRVYEVAGEAFESYRGDKKYLKYLELNAGKLLSESKEYYFRDLPRGYHGLNLELNCAGEFYARMVVETAFEHALDLLAENKTKECVKKMEDLIMVKPYYDVLEAYALALSNLSGVNSFKFVKPYFFMSLASLYKRMNYSEMAMPGFGMSSALRILMETMFYSAGLFLKRFKNDSDAKNILKTDYDSYLKMITEESAEDAIGEFLEEEFFKNSGFQVVDLNEKKKKAISRKELDQSVQEDREMFSEQMYFLKRLDFSDIIGWKEIAKQKRLFVKELETMLFARKHKNIYEKSESLGPMDYRKIKEDLRLERIK